MQMKQTKQATKARTTRKARPLGIVLYRGPSMIDGAPIVVIANRLKGDSNNEKTGAMVQTWILREDVAPLDALKSGADSSVCGQCKHRPALALPDAKGKRAGSCYVQVGRAPTMVWNAYKRGRYVESSPEALAHLDGAIVRLGSYGDPFAAPASVWRGVAERARKLTGYSHQWANMTDADADAFRQWCMASADTPEEAAKARAQGWRYFRVRTNSESIDPANEFVCPASSEAGFKTNCAACGACGGLSSKAKASPVIVAHGPTAKRYTLIRARMAETA